MMIAFYIASLIALFCSVMAITRKSAFNALLYMIVFLLSLAVDFYILGAPFIAALEVIIYAGAIMVLFIFVIMMLNLGQASVKEESRLLSKKSWLLPSFLALSLLVEVIYIISLNPLPAERITTISPKSVGTSLFGPYLIAVELAAMLLLAGIVGAYHLGNQKKTVYHRFEKGGNA